MNIDSINILNIIYIEKYLKYKIKYTLSSCTKATIIKGNIVFPYLLDMQDQEYFKLYYKLGSSFNVVLFNKDNFVNTDDKTLLINFFAEDTRKEIMLCFSQKDGKFIPGQIFALSREDKYIFRINLKNVNLPTKKKV